MKKSLIMGAALAGACLALLTPAGPASAHPLGNFSINQYAGVEIYPDRVDVRVIVDYAELPTLQARSTVDASGGKGCAELAPDVVVAVDGTSLRWTVRSAGFAYRPGAAGLETSVLTCEFTALARLDRSAEVRIDNAFLADRVGWRELTAVGHGVTLADGAPPSRSASDELRSYPQDLLSSPLDQRSAHFRTTPGGGAVAGAAESTNSTRVAASASEGLWGGEAWLRSVVGADGITPVVGALAVILALLLGAGHAALPGHGKTVMAVYLAGRAGRARDALAVGLTVTATHTGGVLIVGLLLTTTASFTGESVLGWLGVASGVLVVLVGGGMLLGALRHRHQHRHGHDHAHGHHHDHGHHGHQHHRWGLAGMGIAGGLVPSPSALIVLLGAIGLGRTGFGVLLVLAYGFGMAIMLTLAGLVLLRLRQRWADRRWMARLSGTHPSVTAGLVIALGCGLIGRAAGLLG